nr:HAMP domain-containing sensor histidine kinase [Paenibacillus caui]
MRTLFIRYLFAFCIGTFLLALLLIAALYSLMASGVILPSNYAEKQALAAIETVKAGKTLSPNPKRDLYKYAKYTPGGKMIAGNLSDQSAKAAWDLTQQSESGQKFPFYYLKANHNSDVYIIRYSIAMQFNSLYLRKYLPAPELLAILLFCAAFLVEGAVMASSFARKLTRRMSGLQQATKKIQEQDLDFSIESSGVVEIDNVLYSMDKMKEALKVSLNKQWDLEQTRREQISALAHDVKTPLTIVRGNVELLAETNQTGEQQDYTNYIMESTRQMEQYIKTLIEITKAETGATLQAENIDSRNYLDNIERQINALAAVDKLEVDISVRNVPPAFYGDPGLLHRAMMNVLSNAVEFSPKHGRIWFVAEAVEDRIRFAVTDEGPGFSKAALKQATGQFYMGDPARRSKNHYGMGLYITKFITNLHGGTLQIDNSPQTGGGQVTIEIPVKPSILLT